MFEWSEEHAMVRDAVRQFVENEIRPERDELEFGDTAPYDVLRKMFQTFGLDALAREQFKKRIERERAAAEGSPTNAGDDERASGGGGGAMFMIPIIELCRCSPGMVTAMGVSVGLTPAAIMSKGTIEQKERWALDLLTLDKIGAWAITEPNSGSDAFGGMQSTARRDGEEYVLNGSKTFITNGPYADTTVFICKLDEDNAPEDRKVLHFVLDKGLPGFEQSKPLRKMGLHSSPTGQLFLSDVRVGRDRLLGETEEVTGGGGRDAAKATFTMERTGVAAMALGIVERCLELCLDYAKERVQFGKPIIEKQGIAFKLADMKTEIDAARLLVWRACWMAATKKRFENGEGSMSKLKAGEVAVKVTDEAIQILGGYGYVREHPVERWHRDSKIYTIFEGTSEIQRLVIARAISGVHIQ
jgi:acyl-CoA dehydrogenase